MNYTNKPEESYELSPEAHELLNDLIQAFGGSLLDENLYEQDQLTDSFLIERLVRYHSADLEPDECHALMRLLTKSAERRRLSRRVRQELSSLHQLTWEQLSVHSAENTLTGQAASVWLKLMSERLARVESERDGLFSAGWERIRAAAVGGAAGFSSALAAFQNFTVQLRSSLEAPRIAMAMSGESAAQLVSHGLESQSWLLLESAEIDREGRLRVEAIVRDPDGRPSSAFDGDRLLLSLRLDREEWPLLESSVRKDRIVWEAFGLGEVLELSGMQLPSETLSVSRSEALARLPVSESLSLLAIPVLEDGAPAGLSPEELELAEPPRWTDGQFTVTVRLSPLTRLAYAGYRLELSLSLVQGAPLLLGSWPLDDWTEDVRQLTAVCPGAGSLELSFASALSALLKPPLSPL